MGDEIAGGLVSHEDPAGLTLDELAARVRDGIHAVGTGLRRTAADVVRTGGYLVAAKAKVGHGEWLRWREANAPEISEDTAQRWMKLHREHANTAEMRYLKPTQAYRLIGKAKYQGPKVDGIVAPEPVVTSTEVIDTVTPDEIDDDDLPIEEIEARLRVNIQEPCNSFEADAEDLRAFDEEGDDEAMGRVMAREYVRRHFDLPMNPAIPASIQGLYERGIRWHHFIREEQFGIGMVMAIATGDDTTYPDDVFDPRPDQDDIEHGAWSYHDEDVPAHLRDRVRAIREASGDPVHPVLLETG